jgi:ribosomal protein L12E/L44/L45/RPP1/RPP2
MDAAASPPAGALTREQLDQIQEDLDAGADPRRLALWLARISDRSIEETEILQAAAEDLANGDGAKWYAAADKAQA